jgi:putative nucleotidyltransferase with HDIG domain
MARLENLRRKVAALYASENISRADWADWMYEGHVLLVAKSAREVAEKYGGNPELAEAAALLHDVADTIMKREDPEHETKSLEMARTLLKENSYNEVEASVVVEDAIAKHSCHGAIRPTSAEGKAMATGDAIVHLTSDFYTVAEKRRKQSQSKEEISAWLLPKIDRDFYNKIAYESIREELKAQYEELRNHFSRDSYV